MKTLTEKLNMQFGERENAYKIRNANVDSLDKSESAICSVTYGNMAFDYDSAVEIVAVFCNAANEETGYTVSVWLDE